MKKVVIIGSGPAGISASLYVVRAGLDTMVIAKDGGTLSKGHQIDNYYGFANGINGQELSQAGIEQAENLGVKIITDEVVGISFFDKFIVKTSSKEYEADSVILATGSSRVAPKIMGLKEFEGQGVSYCAMCDGFFFRGKDIAVLGSGQYALNEALELMPIVGSVTILTNGEETNFDKDKALDAGIKIDTKKIEAFTGDTQIQNVRFADGSEIFIDGVFIAMGVAGSVDLAREIGAITEGNKIIVDEKMATNVPGLFAAGDCTGGMIQVAKAVHEGAKAGTNAVRFSRDV